MTANDLPYKAIILSSICTLSLFIGLTAIVVTTVSTSALHTASWKIMHRTISQQLGHKNVIDGSLTTTQCTTLISYEHEVLTSDAPRDIAGRFFLAAANCHARSHQLQLAYADYLNAASLSASEFAGSPVALSTSLMWSARAAAANGDRATAKHLLTVANNVDPIDFGRFRNAYRKGQTFRRTSELLAPLNGLI